MPPASIRSLSWAIVGQVGHGGALGIAYHAMATTGSNSALPYDEQLIGMVDSGIIASGPIISLMDMATSLAIWVKLGRFRHQATLDMRVDYLRPATPGKTIIGRGECYARHPQRRVRPGHRP